MGFLEFNKIKSLEMFLTDKGKQRMLEMNGLGLSELITRFTLYDDDFDYRTTSPYWADGLSPQPQNTSSPGTTQTSINWSGLVAPQYFNRKFEVPTSGATEFYDIPDVRGHRGRPVIDCHPITGLTSMLNCTNVYCFYDVTSVSFSNGLDCKNGIENWITNYRLQNTGWTGMVFHIPIYGERWVNSAYYPWHGELDTCSYGLYDNLGLDYPVPSTGAKFSPNNCTYDTTIGSRPGLKDRMLLTNSVFNAQWGVTPGVSVAEIGDAGLEQLFGVTGLYCGVECNQPYLPSFCVLPPGTITGVTDGGVGNSTYDMAGSKLEWFVTGCSQNYTRMHPSWDLVLQRINPVSQSPITITFTAQTQENGGTSYTFPASSWYSDKFNYQFTDEQIQLRFDSWWDDFEFVDTDNGCGQNCCSDDYMDTGSLFGCQDCNPFNNKIGFSTGYTINASVMHTPEYSAGTTNVLLGSVLLYGKKWDYPCELFKGGDRNVLVINTTNESGTSSLNWGGIFPLGQKSYYGKGNVTLGSPTTTLIDNWGAVDAAMPMGWDNHGLYPPPRGYHGQSSGVQMPVALGTWLTAPGTFSSNAQTASYNMGWGPTGLQHWGTEPSAFSQSASATLPQGGGGGQPTPDWQYCQDLFLRTYAFYDNFRGFLYPAMQNYRTYHSHFLQHSFGAIMGRTVSKEDIEPANPSLWTRSNPNLPLTAVTHFNPYCALVPVQYKRPLPPYSPTTTPAWGNDGSAGCVGQMAAGYSPSGINCLESTTSSFTNLCSLSGLRNYGWGVNITVGCVGGGGGGTCTNIFSGPQFQSDLSAFITGSSSTNTGIECTYCNCLPAVFINRVGPPDPIIINDGCECPDGTYDPACCPDPWVVEEEIGCGPLPVISSTIRNYNSSTSLGAAAAFSNYSTPESNAKLQPNISSLQSLGNLNGSGNWGNDSGLGGMDLSSTTNRNARTGLAVSIGAVVQPFSYEHEDQVLIDYDILFTSESFMDDYKINKGDAKFYWIINEGLESSPFPGHQSTLIPCNRIDASELKKRMIGGTKEDFIYLNTIRNKENSHYWKDKNDELCITLAVEVESRVQIKTKRLRITGNEFNGWIIRWITS